MKKIIQIPVLLTLLLILSACSRGELTVKDAWARPALAGNNSAIYFVIENSGEADTLLSAATDAATTVEMHMSMAVEEEQNTEHNMEGMSQGEVMTMVRQENVSIPRRGEVTFAPGGLHVMLVGVSSDLAVDDTIELTLTFEKAGTMTLQVPVEER